MTKPALTLQDFADAAALLGVSPSAVRAVCEVEAPRGGFNPDGTPVTLFEGHQFYRLTRGKFAKTAPDLCFPKWTREFYGKTWQAEKARMDRACALDRDAALKSASWGKFQIMGFNHAACGFSTVQAFVNAMYAGEREHLMAFVKFVQGTGLVPALRRRDWAEFAHGYNGPGYKENAYHTKLAAAFGRFESETV